MKDKNFGVCPLCNSLESKALFSAETAFSKFHIAQCKVCELARTLPFHSEDVFRLYDINSYYGRDKNKFSPLIQVIRNLTMHRRAKKYLSLVSHTFQRPKVLDVGCAEGRLLKSFLEYGCQCWGIEHPSYPAYRFLDKDRILYIQGDLQDINFRKGQFDLIFLWHTLEHMDNPQLVMNRLCGLLAPKGAIIVAVPNFSSIEAQRFKQFWFHLDIPWHKYHFNERSIRFLAKKNRLRVFKMSTLCFEQGPYGLLQSIFNAMGWPKNEFYEVLKGNMIQRRSVYIIIQFFLGIVLSIPVSLVSLLQSSMGKGPVLKLIFRSFKE